MAIRETLRFARLFLRLHERLGNRAPLLLEFFDSACSIDEALLLGVERVTPGADFDVYPGTSRICIERVAAATLYCACNVLRMNAFFHNFDNNKTDCETQKISSEVRHKPE